MVLQSLHKVAQIHSGESTESAHWPVRLKSPIDNPGKASVFSRASSFSDPTMLLTLFQWKRTWHTCASTQLAMQFSRSTTARLWQRDRSTVIAKLVLLKMSLHAVMQTTVTLYIIASHAHRIWLSRCTDLDLDSTRARPCPKQSWIRAGYVCWIDQIYNKNCASACQIA